MKLLPTLALLFTTALATRADVVIEQKVESAMLNGNMVLKIRADQARMDMPSPAGQMTVLWNFKTGETVTLMTAQKMAMKARINNQTPPAHPAPKATGVTEKVGAYNADVYEIAGGQAPSKMWVAKDFPNADALKAELKKMSGATPMGGFDTSMLEIPGMMVKSQMTTPAGPVTVTLVSARQEPVPDSEFAVPAGYKEFGGASPMPAASKAPAPAPAAPAPAPVAPAAPATAPEPAISAKARHKWEERFKEMDTNGDGKLTLAEFMAGAMGKKTPEKAKTFFKTVDKNNVGFITLEQFIVARVDGPAEAESGQPATAPNAKPAAPAAAANSAGGLVIIRGTVTEEIDNGLLVETAPGTFVWLGDSKAKVRNSIEISARKLDQQRIYPVNGKTLVVDAYRATLK